MKILLVGGGSGGPVAPLLAVAEYIRKTHPACEFLLVGTKNGPEKNMAQNSQVRFASITSGKLRRYFSWLNFFSPFLIIIGFFQSLAILNSFRPNVVFGTGSFVQVPLIWAAWLRGTPIVIHQQDVYPSLANKLCSLVASRITVTFEKSQRDFVSGFGLFSNDAVAKVVWTGNPYRESLSVVDKPAAKKFFHLTEELPVVLVFGGGTGAHDINMLISQSLPQLTKIAQIVHSTGRGKTLQQHVPNYYEYEFINDMGKAYAAADLVICRAGLSTITELSILGKISIIIPMPNSHQLYNAALVAEHRAAIVAAEKDLNPELLVNALRKIFVNGSLQRQLSENMKKIMPHHGSEKVAEVLLSYAHAAN